jgi:hypothetical protein
MGPRLASIECACVHVSALAELVDLRREPGVTVTLAGDRAWIRWDPASGAILRRVLPLPGAELYERRGELWFRHGHRLPSFGLPIQGAEAVPLHRAVLPMPAHPEPPVGVPSPPVELTLVRDGQPRDTSAIRCGLEALGRWAEVATTARLGALRAARSDDRVLLLGRPLPPLAGVERFWGDRVLIPLGFRPEPDLPEPALHRALGADRDTLLVLTSQGAELVPLAAFNPLTRAGIRLALGSRPS